MSPAEGERNSGADSSRRLSLNRSHGECRVRDVAALLGAGGYCAARGYYTGRAGTVRRSSAAHNDPWPARR